MMENKKMVETIEKKLGVKVEKVLEVMQEGKEVIANVGIGGNDCMKIQMKEIKNQYGPYYKIVSSESYKLPAEEKKEAPARTAKLRTKTEKLCGATRKAIIDLAEKTISSVADGSARIKEIEGAALNDTVIRFVLLTNADNSRFKEDIEISRIRESLAV